MTTCSNEKLKAELIEITTGLLLGDGSLQKRVNVNIIDDVFHKMKSEKIMLNPFFKNTKMA